MKPIFLYWEWLISETNFVMLILKSVLLHSEILTQSLVRIFQSEFFSASFFSRSLQRSCHLNAKAMYTCTLHLTHSTRQCHHFDSYVMKDGLLNCKGENWAIRCTCGWLIFINFCHCQGVDKTLTCPLTLLLIKECKRTWYTKVRRHFV